MDSYEKNPDPDPTLGKNRSYSSENNWIQGPTLNPNPSKKIRSGSEVFFYPRNCIRFLILIEIVIVVGLVSVPT